MSAPWSDLGDTAAHAIGDVVYSAPFNGDNTPYVLTQRFMQPRSSYSPLALNTAHPSDSSYKLVAEQNFKDEGELIVTWDRVYAKVPAQRIDLSTMNYNFIGFWGPRPASTGADPSIAYGRDRKVHFVKVKHQFDYYLVDGVSPATQYDVLIVAETKYRGPKILGQDNPVETDYLWDTAMPGGTTFANASDPSLTTYKSWMAADAASTSSFSIVAQGSSVRRWMGNIWERETLYIKAI